MKANFPIRYELLGSHPEVECLRDELDQIILRYEKWQQGREAVEDTELMTLMLDPEFNCGMADARVIQACAAHFYGLNKNDYATVLELIGDMNAIEDELRNR